jgi:hypothetical protein
MNISIDLNAPGVTQFLVYLLLSIVVVTLVTGVARARVGLGYFWLIILALAGGWVFAHAFRLQIFGGIDLAGIPLIEAFTGAMLFTLIGLVASGRSGLRRHA